MPDSPAAAAEPCRILVAGASGAGKTTLARRIADATGLPYQEIDALYHGPDWTPRPSFVDEVDAFTAQPGWVTEWQYEPVRDRLAERAQLLVFLDYSRARVMRQVIARTVRRRLRREELWNGNIEPPFHTIFSDPEHIVRWAWRTHGTRAALVADAAAANPGLEVVRLRHPRATEEWLSRTFPAPFQTGA
ncbi:AAA family ATPase [Agromyces sp. NPDC058136]|uniref:AAA family ATPase n=1 Tax=Agromyces sp. NPDC058136 TaxID=3346354 RepID=UPI0036DA8231